MRDGWTKRARFKFGENKLREVKEQNISAETLILF